MTDNEKTLQVNRTSTPDDFILPQDLEVPILNIENAVRRNEKFQKQILESQLRSQDLLNELIKVNLRNEKLLTGVLGILESEADDGQRVTITDTAISSEFFIINTEKIPGHPIRAYEIKNDGPNVLFVSENEHIVGPSLEDVLTRQSRFYPLKKNEQKRFAFNRKKIQNIYVVSDPRIKDGKSNFRADLIW